MLSLNYEEIKWTYTMLDPNGTSQTASTGWNILKNMESSGK